MVQSEGPERRGILGFWALVVTQFQGAFNDNAYKWLITFFLVDLLGKSAAQERQIVAVIGGLFAVPFLLFPVYAGTLADRFSKQRIAVAMKYFELVIMALGLLGFWLQLPMLIWPTLFLMLTQSAFFSPAKYGLLPEILPERKLSWGNGVIQMGTFVAIILGTVAAGYLYDALEERVYLTSLPLLGLSVLGLACSHFITRPPAANPAQRIHVNPWSGMSRYFGVLRRDRWLFLTVLGSAYFLFAGALVQMNVMSLGLHGLQLESKGEIGALAFALALGMGLGSLACGYLSRGKIEVGLVPLGALGMSVVSAVLASPHFGFAGVSVLLFLLGFSGGVYVVPLSAVLQYRSPADMKGGMIATSNFVSFAGVLLAAVVYAALGYMGVGPYHVFVVVSLLTMVVGLYICWLLPVFLLRFILWCLTSTLYRVRVLGRDNVPETGGALLVANHTSFIDAVIIAVSIDRPIRFVMFQDIFETAWIKPFAKAMGAIPISASAGPSDLLDSLRTASDAIRSGELVCLFPEGQISRTGQMLPFKKGFERIMRDVDAPIIPIHLDRLWGSVFSFEGGRFFWKIPRRIPYRITVNFGAAMPGNTAPFELRCRIQELGTEAYATRKLDHPLLHRAFVDAVRRHPFMMAMVDGRTPPLSFLKTYVASIIFARKLGKELGPEKMTGVLLPTSVGAALTNVALVLMGKVPVNLNYTASASARASACEQCGIRHVITSRLFLEKMPMDVPGEVIYLEDVRKRVMKSDRIAAMVLAVFCPVRVVERLLGAPRKRTPDDLATVVFSSGSEGTPKGVMLTHQNISANVEAMAEAFPFSRRDRVMGMLPIFHSFGFTVTLWLPLMRNIGVIYHPNPLEAKAVGGLIYEHRATFFIATSTFLQAFIRRCTPEQLSSLKYVVCGAEKLAPRVHDAFREKFGIEPMEGYGATECSPVVSVNVPDFRSPGFYQKGCKTGSIGHPIPGVAVRTIDPESGERLPHGEPGLLVVRGPNIMHGYLNMPEKTAEVVKDGWYITGDIASIDEDGFITITDRLSRFSKIAGEMIPHTAIEEVLHTTLGLTERAMAVTSVPDPNKGERLVVLHTLTDAQLEQLLEKLDTCGLPNLWTPRPTAFYLVDEIPVLGTGKLDLKGVKTLARQLDVGE